MRINLVCVVAAVVVAVTGCGGSATGPGGSISGTYNLQTVNGATLPFTIQNDATATIDILVDTYVLSPNGTYTNATQERITPAGGTAALTTLNTSGTYSTSGSSVTLTNKVDPADKVSGTVAGSTMTLAVTGLILVYQRSGG